MSRVLHFVFTLGRGQSSACLEMDIEAWLAASYTETDETVVSLPDVVKAVPVPVPASVPGAGHLHFGGFVSTLLK